GRLAYAKTLLGITADQATAWKAYEDASRANVQSLQAAHEARLAAERVGSPIDRMHAQTDEMQSQLDAMKALQPPTEALYKALTPDHRGGLTLYCCCSAGQAGALVSSIKANKCLLMALSGSQAPQPMRPLSQS